MQSQLRVSALIKPFSGYFCIHKNVQTTNVEKPIPIQTWTGREQVKLPRSCRQLGYESSKVVSRSHWPRV